MRRTRNRRRGKPSWGKPGPVVDMDRVYTEMDAFDALDPEERALANEYGLNATRAVLRYNWSEQATRAFLEEARKNMGLARWAK